jgi:hypothetical protein
MAAHPPTIKSHPDHQRNQAEVEAAELESFPSRPIAVGVVEAIEERAEMEIL